MLRRSFRGGLVGVAIATLVLCVPATWAQHAVCTNALEAAEDQYVNSEYEEARRLVAACLNQQDIPAEQAVSAYRLLALVYLKQDQLEQARSAIVNLLGIDPGYTADPVNNPPSYASLVAIVREDVQSQKPAVTASTEKENDDSERRPFFSRSSTWITIGGIVVGSGVATVLALDSGSSGGGGGDPTSSTALPLPPGTP